MSVNTETVEFNNLEEFHECKGTRGTTFQVILHTAIICSNVWSSMEPISIGIYIVIGLVPLEQHA